MKFWAILSTATAIAIGIIVLAGTFFGHNADGSSNTLGNIQLLLLNWAVILAAVALFVGIFNLLAVHGNKIIHKQKGLVYSLILILSLLATLALGLWFGPDHPTVTWIFTSIQLPVEASLMALLAVTLTYASFRLLRKRTTMLSVIFLITAVLILLGTVPLPFLGYLPFTSDIFRLFIAQVLAAGGARGILIGVALGTLTTGLRILFGADRPYGGRQ